jgi:hypothetical protein
MDILPLFCDIDDFCLTFETDWKRFLIQARLSVRQTDPRKRGP